MGHEKLKDVKERKLALMMEEDRVHLPFRSTTDKKGGIHELGEEDIPPPEDYTMKRIPR